MKLEIKDYKDEMRSRVSGPKYKGFIVNNKFTIEFNSLTNEWLVEKIDKPWDAYYCKSKRDALKLVSFLLKKESNKNKKGEK